MRQNIFLGGGPFGSQQVAVMGPTLGQYSYPIDWPGRWGYIPPPPPPPPPPLRRPGSPMRTGNIPQYSWTPGPSPTATFARPTSQPTAAAAGDSDVHCYFCENLPGSPTYWLSGNQAAQWNRDREARCEKVDAKECQEKYGQMRANIRPAGFNVINFPSATTYAPAMSGRIRVENPELIG